ncbi:GNAT family N-acetyltransferase [Tabrizicola fusiformis]|uniref:GNAT family N-acetyltransferase n=1 Tax=Tabrizicola sp. SY72 TaxID=2741673 RepID=UPI00157379C3|nr:GNAT family N-acetyltransferase [Tabrizicola sp. SY72]NTT84677.1 GNAT family N-acetyltransferase [Tabrizicola sp. SY72]
MTLFRPFRPDDITACLALFDGNCPRFFAPSEREEFASFLTAPRPSDAPYLVLEDEGDILACGGIEISGPDAHLTWGMVARDRHGQRLGTRLTEARLALARTLPGVERLILSTSQHTQGFYAGFGFAVTAHTPDGFGPGLDRVDMALLLG